MAQTVGLLGAGVAGAGVAKGLKDLNKLRKLRSACGTIYKFVSARGAVCAGEGLSQVSSALGVTEQQLLQNIDIEQLLPSLLGMVSTIFLSVLV